MRSPIIYIYTISVESTTLEFHYIRVFNVSMKLSVIELNLGHLVGISTNPCGNLYHFSRIYYIRVFKVSVELSVIELNL